MTSKTTNQKFSKTVTLKTILGKSPFSTEMLIVDAREKINGLAYKMGLPLALTSHGRLSTKDDTGEAYAVRKRPLVSTFVWEPSAG